MQKHKGSSIENSIQKTQSYQNLTKIVNDHLIANGRDAITFELYENLNETIYAFPMQKLLSIESDRSFIIETYYKIADWSLDDEPLIYLLDQLESGAMSRIDIIELFERGEEKRLNHTHLIDIDGSVR